MISHWWKRYRSERATIAPPQADSATAVMSPRIVSVVPLEPYVVRVSFGDGEIRDVDIEPLLEGAVFAVLRDHDEFRRVGVDDQTGAIAWPNGADLDSDVIYGIARAPREPSARVTTPQPAA